MEKEDGFVITKGDLSFCKLKQYKYSICFIDTWILKKKKSPLRSRFFLIRNMHQWKAIETLYQANAKENTSYLLILLEFYFVIRK